MNAIIFLDIDGVLNCEEYYKRTRGDDVIHMVAQYPMCEFDPFRIELLNHLTTTIDAKIVLSSSWRHGLDIEEMRNLFVELGIKAELLDYTPNLMNWGGLRGNEIHKWIEDNSKKRWDVWGHNYKTYVIIDDDDDMLLWQKDHFFQTDPYSGLTPNLCYKIQQFLSSIKNRDENV